MKKKIEYTFEWWNDADHGKVEEQHQDKLEKYAEECIIRHRKNGYTEGELYKQFFCIADNQVTKYRGYWSMNITTI